MPQSCRLGTKVKSVSLRCLVTHEEDYHQLYGAKQYCLSLVKFLLCIQAHSDGVHPHSSLSNFTAERITFRCRFPWSQDGSIQGLALTPGSKHFPSIACVMVCNHRPVWLFNQCLFLPVWPLCQKGERSVSLAHHCVLHWPTTCQAHNECLLTKKWKFKLGTLQQASRCLSHP